MSKYTRAQFLQKHILICEAAIRKGLVFVSEDWMKSVYHDIQILELEVELTECIHRRRL